MLKDATWGVAWVACVFVTLYSVDLGVTAWRRFDEGDGPVYTISYNGPDRLLRSNVTVGPRMLDAGPRSPTNASYDAYNVINKSEVVAGPRAAGYEDITKPDDTVSSYLFQPIRYMKKEN